MIAMGSFYDEKRASSELRKYREQGPIPSTRALIDALKAEVVESATLLDIGGGIGAIQHELLDASATRATCVDASAAYLETAREEGRGRGHDSRVPICTATSSTWPTWSVLPRSSHSIESSTSIRAGNGLPDSRPDAPSGCSACLSARHPHGEAHHLRHESDAPATKKAGARVPPFRRCDQADRPGERPHTPRCA
jgi:hypothetical protein